MGIIQINNVLVMIVPIQFFFFFIQFKKFNFKFSRKSWRSLGIYWGAGIINSMIVLVLGIFSGMHQPTFCTFLNVPYVVFPIFAVIRYQLQIYKLVKQLIKENKKL